MVGYLNSDTTIGASIDGLFHCKGLSRKILETTTSYPHVTDIRQHILDKYRSGPHILDISNISM